MQETTNLAKNLIQNITQLGLLLTFLGLASQVFAYSEVTSNNEATIKSEENNLPASFIGFQPFSSVHIDYDDLTQLLNLTVIVEDSDLRKTAKKTGPNIGTRLRPTRNIYVSLEGNRFYFEAFRESRDIAIVKQIRESLQAIPSEIALNELTQSEQLAYWLNFYNIALIEQLIQVYPKKVLSELLYGNDSILDKKSYVIANYPLSLNDIRDKILLTKFKNMPLVMYGLFQGVIGGPNLTNQAYTGQNVMNLLDENARHFVGSNRGVFRGGENSIRVSAYYQKYAILFPDFERDLKRHLLNYVDAEYRDKVAHAEHFVADIQDYHIADIHGGESLSDGAASTSRAALLNSMKTASGDSVSFKPPTMKTKHTEGFLEMTARLQRLQQAKSGQLKIEMTGTIIQTEIHGVLKAKESSNYVEELQAFEEEEERKEKEAMQAEKANEKNH